MTMKNTGNVLNASVIETWMNETLADAEHLEIPGVVVKPAHKSPIVRYQIDRVFLVNSGVQVDEIDRIYRGLFVYSIGFYEMIQKCLTHAKNKYTLLSNVWKVFSILLEYCCKSNYRMMIAKISTEHQEKLEELEEEMNKQISVLNLNEKNLKQQVDDLQRENGALRK
jgi:gas vesicle protein